MLDAKSAQTAEAIEKLLFGKAIFGILGVVHNIVADGKIAARVKPAADGFGNGRKHLRDGIDIRVVVQIDDGAQLVRIGKILPRRAVRGKDDPIAGCAQRLCQHELGVGRAIPPHAFLQEKVQQAGRGRGFDGEILLKPRVPGKCLFGAANIFQNSLLIVEMKRSWIGLDNFFYLFECNKWLLHEITFPPAA